MTQTHSTTETYALYDKTRKHRSIAFFFYFLKFDVIVAVTTNEQINRNFVFTRETTKAFQGYSYPSLTRKNSTISTF